MVDQETGLRGYAATGQPVFLEPYESGRPQVGPLLRALQRQSRGTRFAAAVDVVQVKAGGWFDWATMRKAQVDVARAPVVDTPADEAGKAEFDEFRVADDHLATLLQDQLQPLLAAAAASRQRVVNALVVGGPLV